MGLRERRKAERRRKKMLKIANFSLNGIAIAAALVVAGVLAAIFVHQKNLREKEKEFETLRQTERQNAVSTEAVTEAVIEIEIETETEEVLYCEPVYDFEELHQQNEDIYAWITVPETQVDYPVLQSITDNYYLEHNMDHSAGYPGSIYTNQCNAKDFTNYITVLYGHNMKNGSMFGSIHKFEDKEFFDANREIVVYTEEKRLTYDIYASVKFSDAYIPAFYDVVTKEGRDSFLRDVEKYVAENDVSHIREEVEILPEDKLIVLSTCVNGERPRRYLVVGKLVEEAFYSDKVQP